jgi:hypothetical protein
MKGSDLLEYIINSVGLRDWLCPIERTDLRDHREGVRALIPEQQDLLDRLPAPGLERARGRRQATSRHPCPTPYWTANRGSGIAPRPTVDERIAICRGLLAFRWTSK